VLRQALVGYLPFRCGPSLGKAACTIQVVETRMNSRTCRLVLNVLGRVDTGEDFWQAAKAASDRRLADLFDKGELKLRHLSSRRPGAERSEEIAGLLKHLAAGVERICRQEGRRTKHARLRHRDPSRPAGSALQDSVAAKAEDFFLDRRRKTFVVLGPRCRAHFFNREGHHVTSLVFRGEDIEHRKQTRQWTALEPEERERLRQKILGAGNDEP
jgi:hypothetical protein